jgi:Fe-Mn family superoxide dismutase
MLAEAINAKWGSFTAFQKAYEEAGASLFGSGWVWLASDAGGNLVITQESNGGNPVTRDLTPLMGIDVWEHAYYLDYQNRRADHLKAVWKIINWKTVEERFRQVRGQ